MYTGQIDVISSKATWASENYTLFDPDDGTETDLTNPDLILDIVVTISEQSYGTRDYGILNPSRIIATASIANGKVSVPGPGFQWQFEVDDLSSLCAGTYRLGAKVTMNGAVQDVIDGTIAVLEGNPS